jgi:hypothetical protein
LEELLGESLRATDFTDDRLGQVLSHLSDDKGCYRNVFVAELGLSLPS